MNPYYLPLADNTRQLLGCVETRKAEAEKEKGV
jgi:hypothetical protein